MNSFAPVLRETSERLSVPQPARSRILLEIAADMEDLYRANLDRGLSEEEARRQAIDSCDLSPESLEELATIHCGPVRRLIDRLSRQALARWEYALLVIVVLITVMISAGLTRGGNVIGDAGVFVWPVLLLGLVIVLISTGKAYQLYLKQDHTHQRLNRGLGLLLHLVVGLPLLGFTGSWCEVWRLVRMAEPEAVLYSRAMLIWALHSTALLQVSLALAVLGALAWFQLSLKVGKIEKEEAAILLEF
ncbi:MAG: hypothetical protein GY835_01885 [bacterium]|nr:hypothetical protein [bacterium]